jgi:transcriptional regulator with XRE-family HTH domain
MMGKFSEYVNTEVLRQERYAKRISMFEMAKLLGKKSASSYSNLEDGSIEPRISDINKIADIFGKSATIFFNLKVQETCTLD